MTSDRSRVLEVVVLLIDGGGRGRPRSDRRAFVFPVNGLLFDGDFLALNRTPRYSSCTQLMNQNLEQLIANISRFLRDEAYPLEQSFLQQPFKELVSTLAAKREQVKAAGMWTPHLPKEYGGLGLTLSEFARVSEELGRTPIGHYLFNCQAPDIEEVMTYWSAA